MKQIFRKIGLGLAILLAMPLASYAKNRYQSDLLAQIAESLQIKNVLDTMSNGSYIAQRTYKSHPLSIIVEDGEVEHIGHSDVLGAIMSLGFERNRLGDIIMGNARAGVVTDKKLADYLLTNLTQIGHSGVKCQLADLSTIPPKEEKYKELRATVASLRVDSIAAAGYGVSRSRAAADIAADKLKLNWQPVKNSSQNVKEGDTLSLRGRGRLEVAEVRGQTKKGRIGVLLKRYY